MGLFDTAVSGLNSAQRALATTSHNIANVNTEGYSRQRVELASNTPELFGGTYIGKGVHVADISRVYDGFLYNQVLSRTSSSSEYDAYLGVANNLDATLGDPDSGLTNSLQTFFNSIQDMASNPTSTPARQVVISEADSLANRFHVLNGQMDDLTKNVNQQLDIAVLQINDIATSIGDLNGQIVRATGQAGGSLPNDLLDQRDRLLKSLAEMTNVTSNVQADQSMNVFIGTGQALVLGTASNKLQIINDEFDITDRQIAFAGSAGNVPITDQLTGGTIGGLLAVKDEVIKPAQLALGRIAIGISSNLNTQHQAGVDVNGNAGGLFFNDLIATSPTVFPSSNNNPASGTVSVSIDDVNALEVSDYRLTYDGSNFSLMRMSDKTVVDSGFAIGSMPRTVAGEGITVSLAGSLSAGDSFMVRPLRNGAGQIGVAISDPATIAAAATGTASGNNANALLLAGQQTSQGLGNGTASYQQAFAITMADVGVKTSRARVGSEAQQVLLNQAIESHSNVSGVNLDEEAANLLKYQQAYEASARVITVLDDVFQSLLNAVS